VRRLERDDVEANAHHAVVDRLMRCWLNVGRVSGEDVSTLKDHLTALEALYRTHIAAEDHHLFAAAARILSAHDIREIGREMAARRAVEIGA
jgi:hypothetical protein